MRRTRISIVLAMVVSANVACGSFGSSSGSGSDPVVDAGTISETSAPPPSPPPVADGSSPPDSGDGGSLCSGSSHWICEDFDHGGGPGSSAWDPSVISGGGTLAIVPGASPPSPPLMLRADAPPNGAGRLARTLIVAATGLRCDFFLNPLARSDGEASLATFELDGLDASLRLELRSIGAANASIEESGKKPADAGNFLTVQAVTLPSRWINISIDIAFGSGGKAEVRFDGELVATTTPAALGTFQNAVQVSAIFGPAVTNVGTAPSHNAFDDIVCDHY